MEVGTVPTVPEILLFPNDWVAPFMAVLLNAISLLDSLIVTVPDDLDTEGVASRSCCC